MPTEETPITPTVSTDTSMRSAIRMIMALPSTTIEAKRSFSCMKRVKTWLRSTMTSDRLSDLCVLHCHSERINDMGSDEWTFNRSGAILPFVIRCKYL